MEHAELKKRLSQLVGPEVDACWLDGSKCPYGQPHGQFQNRPLTFCKFNVCKKLAPFCNDFEEVASIEYAINQRVKDALEKEVVEISNELEVMAEDIKDGTKRRLLMLAADLIRSDPKIKDVRIIREENI